MSENPNLLRSDRESVPATLVVLCFNSSEYIKRAVDSALAQNYSPLEILLSDDCSSDDTYEIISKIADVYDGPHCVRINRNDQNLGLGEHINLVFKLARSEWIILAAGDDISFPFRVSKIMKVAEQPNVRAVFSNAELIDNRGQSLGKNLDHFECQSTIGFSEMVRSLGGVGHGATYAYHRDTCNKFPPLDPNVVAEDRVLPLRASMLGDVVYISKPLIQYRRDDASLGVAICQDLLLNLDRPSQRAKTYWQTLYSEIRYGHELGLITQDELDSSITFLTTTERTIRARCRSNRWNPLIRLSGIAGLTRSLFSKHITFSKRQILKWCAISLLGPIIPIIRRMKQNLKSTTFPI